LLAGGQQPVQPGNSDVDQPLHLQSAGECHFDRFFSHG
jgi:hypothetical protein